jgi:hypothetical protein
MRPTLRTFSRSADPSYQGFTKVIERTLPADDKKEVFFRNLISCLLDSRDPESVELFQPSLFHPIASIQFILQFFSTFRALDIYTVLIGWPVPRSVTHWITYVVLNVATSIAALLGIQPVYSEYTPDRLWQKHCQKVRKTQ